MTVLQSATVATSPTATEGDVKSFLTNLRAFMADFLGMDSANKQAALALMGTLLNGSASKTATYTVLPTDRGKVLRCSGTFTVNAAAAATLGDGFSFAIWNIGTGVITVDPNLNEAINGALTMTVSPGKLAIIYCDGAGFVSVGGIDTGPGSGLNADLLDGYHAAAFALAGHTHAYAPMTALVAITTRIDSNSAVVCTCTRANGTTFEFATGAYYSGSAGG
ncbi:hypothetical protein [Pseudomonas sp.]|uniref:hypothetical protein n=1 Tax=Pseudomonas sp. TaxID=306 RepID=UPI003F365498